jgi:hypothetical protein
MLEDIIISGDEKAVAKFRLILTALVAEHELALGLQARDYIGEWEEWKDSIAAVEAAKKGDG